ncbi:hypothetical protein [Actinophytocola sp.]|uniref:hypothetical protein n=1 Tax=Actinophytocola sp. TaxID=1872138 RepID=UPI002ED0D979
METGAESVVGLADDGTVRRGPELQRDEVARLAVPAARTPLRGSRACSWGGLGGVLVGAHDAGVH